MKTLRAVIIVLVCAVVVSWLANQVVTLRAQSMPSSGQLTMRFAHDNDHHREHGEHHGRDGSHGASAILGSTALFGGVAAAVIIPSVLLTRRRRQNA